MLPVFAFLLLAPGPGANRKHCQDRHGRILKLRIAERCPRQGCQHRVHTERHEQPIHPTPNIHHRKAGAQGRIRTSVARKERQIYSLLPLTARPPVHIPPPQQVQRRPLLGPQFDRAWTPLRPMLESRMPRPGIASPCYQRTRCQTRRSANPAKLRNSRTTVLPRVLRLGSCCWNQFSRRAARLVWLAPGTPCGALKVTIMELAKGLEPPTL
jgi:hypothetical protein